MICRQGDAADSFYLIRIGFVKVSEEKLGGELVLAYLARGGYFGEIALLTGSPRTATCTALDHVEVVRISAEDFQLMLDKFPDVRHSLEATAHERLAENRRRAIRTENVPVDQFLAQGLMEAQSLLVLDLERCTRCDQCVRACADAHDGVTRLVREGLRFDKYLVATSCRQCRDPLCMVGCPVGSIRRRNTLEVIIEDWCIGCGLCANNCPYGNINLHPFPVEVDDPAHPGRQIASVKVEGDVLRFVPRSCRAQLRVRLSARCGAPGESAGILRQYYSTAKPANEDEELGSVRIDHTHRKWFVGSVIGLAVATAVYVLYSVRSSARPAGRQRTRPDVRNRWIQLHAVCRDCWGCARSFPSGEWDERSPGCAAICGWDFSAFR